ncbi:MAG: hypothetical protein QOI78_1314 [Actinomycetota bacterium]|nr:hypothetical protein [Actinomycetota bacterium]
MLYQVIGCPQISGLAARCCLGRDLRVLRGVLPITQRKTLRRSVLRATALASPYRLSSRSRPRLSSPWPPRPVRAGCRCRRPDAADAGQPHADRCHSRPGHSQTPGDGFEIAAVAPVRDLRELSACGFSVMVPDGSLRDLRPDRAASRKIREAGLCYTRSDHRNCSDGSFDHAMDLCCNRIECDQAYRLHIVICKRNGCRGLDSICTRTSPIQIVTQGYSATVSPVMSGLSGPRGRAVFPLDALSFGPSQGRCGVVGGFHAGGVAVGVGKRWRPACSGGQRTGHHLGARRAAGPSGAGLRDAGALPSILPAGTSTLLGPKAP